MAPVASLDAVMQGAGHYFAQSRLVPILADALAQLAREQPKDALTYFRGLLAAASARRSSSEKGVDGEDPEEAIDLDTLPEDPQDLDALGLVTLERLPGAKQGRGQDLSDHRCWASGFSRPLLEGWLPQPSPCCGAASVAGAFNALFDFGRDHCKSSSIAEVAELMAKNCDRLYTQRQQRIERLLGIESGTLDVVLAVLDEELLARGLHWSGSGPQVVTRTVAMNALRHLLGSQAPADGRNGEVAFQALRRVLGVQTGQEECEEAEAALPCGGGAKMVIDVCGTDWEQEFGELFAKRRGSFRLRVAKPHTGEIGSWGIKQAVIDLAAARDYDPMSAQVLLGRKGGPKAEVGVAKDDSAEAVEQQWTALKSAFARPHSVLLFHLTNHYALIYAWREWVEKVDSNHGLPQKRRQILTARKGQRPTVWLDYDEAHSIMVSWSGYHILQVQRAASSSSPAARVEVGSPGGA